MLFYFQRRWQVSLYFIIYIMYLRYKWTIIVFIHVRSSFIIWCYSFINLLNKLYCPCRDSIFYVLISSQKFLLVHTNCRRWTRNCIIIKLVYIYKLDHIQSMKNTKYILKLYITQNAWKIIPYIFEQVKFVATYKKINYLKQCQITINVFILYLWVIYQVYNLKT